jgi:murein hydrolase activator
MLFARVLQLAARGLRPQVPLCVLFVCALGTFSASGAHAAAKPTERSKQKATAETARADIAKKLGALKRDIGRTENEKEHVADALSASEAAISDAKRALRELAEEQGTTNARLHELATAQQRLTGIIEAQKKQLSTLLKEQYVAGNEDRIKLLLSGDNPNRINRDLQLMAYVSQAQAKLINALRENLNQVEANKADTENAKAELEEIAGEQREQQALLEKEKKKRVELMGSLSKRLDAQRKEVSTLQQDEQRLSNLIDNLTKVIKEQAEAAAAKAKKDAQDKAERLRLAQEKAKNAKPGTKAQPEPPEPKVAQQPDISLAPVLASGAFAGMRGHLQAPINGKLVSRFGAKKGEGISWKGVFLKAPEGAEVRAVAAGRVVHSDWMRGYGNMIMIAHGDDYYTIYGNAEALLKQKGDAVKAGELIANAGNTGSTGETGLYFEMRAKGSPLDPATWVKFP